MISTYRDTCRGCGEAIFVGDEIHWAKESGTRCTACGPAQPDERRGSATEAEDVPGYAQRLRDRVDALQTELSTADIAIQTLSAQVVDLLDWAARVSDDLGITSPIYADERETTNG